MDVLPKRRPPPTDAVVTAAIDLAESVAASALRLDFRTGSGPHRPDTHGLRRSDHHGLQPQNQSTLTASEKSCCVAAVLALKARGKYDQYVTDHVNAMAWAPPWPGFLPLASRVPAPFRSRPAALDATVSLPYWNERSPAHRSASSSGLARGGVSTKVARLRVLRVSSSSTAIDQAR